MLQIGDTIKCHDPEDMIDTMHELSRGGTTWSLYMSWTEKKATG